MFEVKAWDGVNMEDHEPCQVEQVHWWNLH